MASASQVAWANTTRSFGELYGAQRGGIELTVVGPAEAVGTVTAAGRHLEVPIGELLAQPYRELPGPPGTFRLQPGIGGLTSLGTSALDTTWTDVSHEPAYYQVRVFQGDGEMAWSSPIWVAPPH